MDKSAVDAELRKQFELLVDDIKLAYEASDKKTSGKFAEGLELIAQPNSISLWGYTFLAGRRAGKMPPVQKILKWIEQKGIKPIKDKMTTTSLAWAIARKIARDGTNPINHKKIYEEVITPQRIDQIIKAVNVLNVNWFIAELSTQMELLTKNK